MLHVMFFFGYKKELQSLLNGLLRESFMGIKLAYLSKSIMWCLFIELHLRKLLTKFLIF